MVYGGGAIAERFRSDSRPMRSDGVFAVVGLDGNIHHGDGGTPSLRKQRKSNQMVKKFCGFQSRKIAAFLAGLVTGVLIGGCCSVFGPGVGVSVY